jgi:transcriptional regulator with XRE-family HTH domain
MKTIYTSANNILLEWLASKRMLKGATQKQISEALNKPQSFVSKYENGERRLDVIEVIEICNILNADPRELINTLINEKYKN